LAVNFELGNELMQWTFSLAKITKVIQLFEFVYVVGLHFTEYTSLFD